MRLTRDRLRHWGPAALIAALLTTFVPISTGAVPPEVDGLTVDPASTLLWNPAAEATEYEVYRGLTSLLATGDVPRCHGLEIMDTAFATPDDPAVGEAFSYLVTANSADGFGTPGQRSDGQERALLGRCQPAIKHHLLSRAGFGRDEWTSARYDALGRDAYLAEQLDPLSISEAGNDALSSRLDALTPAADIFDLAGQSLVRATYARRQLEQQATIFWTNHFSTAFQDIRPFFNIPIFEPEEVNALAVETQHREMESFRDLAFSGTFREILETSALSPAMILYLDNNENIAEAPNENYAREILELHALGVDGGYTQHDIEELARALSGWNVCKKVPSVQHDPLGTCIPRVLEGTTAGAYVANFRPEQHDNGQKILFEGTAFEKVIPDSSANPDDGMNDLFLALDAIAGHDATARFVSKKLLERFITDSPSEEMIDEIVATWDASGGTLRDILEAALTHEEFLDPDRIASKIRTPLEHVSAVMRAIRGRHNGKGLMRSYLLRMQHVPHAFPVPTGYPEAGDAWIDTNNTLERQNFGLDIAVLTGAVHGTDLIGLMEASGITSASEPEEVIAFWTDILFASALTPPEIAEAVDYLSSDDNGDPLALIDDDHVRETVGFMLGYPQFQTQ